MKNILCRVVPVFSIAALFITCSLSTGEDENSWDLDLSFYTPPAETAPYPLVEAAPVRNIILMVGDGMALAHITASRVIALGPKGKLHIERMPVTGFINHYELGEYVSGSAATATSLATGFKTNGGMIGMLPGGTPAYTILEAARDRGLSTGLVATTTITHATPASFAAHVPSRDMEKEIAAHMLDNKVQVILGGGRPMFKAKSDEVPNGRTDGRDLVREALDSGYEYVETGQELTAAQGDLVLGLFSDGIMLNTSPEPSLAEMTEKAIDILSRNNEGFFLMVEGSQIDWGAHDNDLEYTVREQLHFDLAIKKAIDFAMHDGETIVVVTADHETGGMAISEDSPDIPGLPIKVDWVTGGHTGVPVPVFAYGPHAERFMGWYDNTDIPKRLAGIIGLTNFPGTPDNDN
jgi:alkaline phosphatase